MAKLTHTQHTLAPVVEVTPVEANLLEEAQVRRSGNARGDYGRWWDSAGFRGDVMETLGLHAHRALRTWGGLAFLPQDPSPYARYTLTVAMPEGAPTPEQEEQVLGDVMGPPLYLGTPEGWDKLPPAGPPQHFNCSNKQPPEEPKPPHVNDWLTKPPQEEADGDNP